MSLVRAGMTPAERCRYVADLIEAHPDHFDMGDYFEGKIDGRWLEDLIMDGERPDLLAHCGTTCCIAGWAEAITPIEEVNAACGVGQSAADQLLALDGKGSDLENGLFFMMSLTAPDAAFLLRWHADELDRA